MTLRIPRSHLRGSPPASPAPAPATCSPRALAGKRRVSRAVVRCAGTGQVVGTRGSGAPRGRVHCHAQRSALVWSSSFGESREGTFFGYNSLERGAGLRIGGRETHHILFRFPLEIYDACGTWLPGGLVARIRRFHRRGPGSIPGQGKSLFCFHLRVQTFPLLPVTQTVKNLPAMRETSVPIPRSGRYPRAGSSQPIPVF